MAREEGEWVGRWVGWCLWLTCVGVLCETKPLWPACVSIIDKAEVQDLASTTEQLANLLFRQACAEIVVSGVLPACIGITIGRGSHHRGYCPQRQPGMGSW